MAFVNPAPIRRNSHLVPTAVALALAGLFSPVHLTLFDQPWSLVWLPFVILSLWPRQAGPVASCILLFLAGLWVDWATLGATGQWPFVFLVTYAVIRPDQAERVRGLTVAFVRLAKALLVGGPVFVLSGWLVYGAWPDWIALGRGIFVAVVMLPLVAFARDMFAGRLAGDDF